VRAVVGVMIKREEYDSRLLHLAAHLLAW